MSVMGRFLGPQSNKIQVPAQLYSVDILRGVEDTGGAETIASQGIQTADIRLIPHLTP